MSKFNTCNCLFIDYSIWGGYPLDLRPVYQIFTLQDFLTLVKDIRRLKHEIIIKNNNNYLCCNEMYSAVY